MRIRRFALCLGLLCGLLAPPAQAQEETLALYYFHRPPFYIRGNQAGGDCQGQVLEKACRVLREAGVPFTLVERPVKRILQEIKWGHYGCGVGWYKLVSRQDFANFSLPLHPPSLAALIVNRHRAAGLPARPTLEQVLASGLTRGEVAGYAYGQKLDDLLARLRPPTVTVTGTSDNMLRMLAGGRCDYWLVNAEEGRWLLEHNPGLASALEIKPLLHAPQGEYRHFMCSQRVPPEVLRRIDLAIVSLYGHIPETPAPSHQGRPPSPPGDPGAGVRQGAGRLAAGPGGG